MHHHFIRRKMSNYSQEGEQEFLKRKRSLSVDIQQIKKQEKKKKTSKEFQQPSLKQQQEEYQQSVLKQRQQYHLEKLEEEEDEIERLEKKLKLGKDQHSKSFKKGLIDDNWEEMFDFIDNMQTSKVNKSMVFRKNDADQGENNKLYEMQLIQPQTQTSQEIDKSDKPPQSSQNDIENDDFFQASNAKQETNEANPQVKEKNKQEKIQQKPKYEWQPKTDIYGQLTQTKTSLEDHLNNLQDYKTHEDYALVRKQIRSLMNKLSESNFERIVNDIIQVFEVYSKYLASEVLADIFTQMIINHRRNLLIIVACSTAILSSLHQLYGHNFFAIFIQRIVVVFKAKFEIITKVKKIMDDKIIDCLQTLKNISMVFSLFIIYDTLDIHFIQEFLEYLCENFCIGSLELIQLVTINSGKAIRKESPLIVKGIIQKISKTFTEFKQKNENYPQQMDFIIETLEQIKVNKNIKNDPTEKLKFLKTFLHKVLVKRFKITRKKFPSGFNQAISADYKNSKWWQPNFHNLIKDDQQKNQNIFKLTIENAQQKKLNELALSQRFSTDIRKQIFFCLMQAEDYLDACQKILRIKLKKKMKKEIALVIIHCCAQEDRFNKYYSYLAQKLIKVDKNFRYHFQYTFLDHFLNLDTYDFRKISNISKIIAFLINQEALNFNMFKAFEFTDLNKHQIFFFQIIFKDYFNKLQHSQIQSIFIFSRITDDLMITHLKKLQESSAFLKEALFDVISEHIQKNFYKIFKDQNEIQQKELKKKIKNFASFLNRAIFS